MIGELPPEERPDVIMSALQWRAERDRHRPPAEAYPPQAAEAPPEGGRPNGHAEPLATVVAATRAGRSVPALFIDPISHLLPCFNVTLLGGDGGIGKSLLILQLAIACTTGTQWIGLEVSQGPVVYFSAEDDLDELTRRMEAICEADGIELNTSFELHLLPFAGHEAALVTESHKSNVLQRTTLFERLEATLAATGAMLLVLDNLADVFCGNENNRALAKAFIGLLRGLCLRHDCTILLLGHPSLSGLASGSGTSGSTAWSNSVRSRLYLHKPDGLDGDDADARILEVMKANYGPMGQRIELKWQAGRFVRSEIKSPWQRVAVADVERVQDRFRSGQWRVNEQSGEWGGYAVAELLDMDVGRGIGTAERSREQARNRQHVRTYLAGWLRSGAIFVVNGFDSYRRPTQFYSHKEEHRV